ncbi:hypothetical protein FRB94_005323 [Tulasnella sp. JGI-2019a]|nr:hypothetical protein FRB93_002791 [Tulasnella sp. JGI-2019a]KAG9000577.1 hypothetical protein FRB94_005323 [Tulasnella sp. JGI-2019a]
MGIRFSVTDSYNPATDMPDLTGKVVLVTGGNSGIGYETVKAFLKKGAKVYLGARNESRATGAIAQLKAEGALNSGEGRVEWLPLDLSTPETTSAGAQEFLRREGRLDILVNNAGIVTPKMDRVANSKVPISALMSTNHLGPFVLTTALLPLLKFTAQQPNADVRVVTLSSEAHGMPLKVDWKSFDGWDLPGPATYWHSVYAYGTSKLANILFAKELQRQFDEQGIPALSLSVHPGAVYTEGTTIAAMGMGPILGRIAMAISNLFFVSPYKGAWNTLFAATSARVRANRAELAGAYLVPVGIIKVPKMGDGDFVVAARDLWETSQRAVAAM